MEKEENRMIRVINTIRKKNKKRACYQSILEKIKREDKDFDMISCKLVIKELLQKNKIVDIGHIDLESFKPVINSISKKSTKKNHSSTTHVIYEEKGHDNEPCSTKKKEGPLTHVEEFIHEKFHQTLVRMIEDEVKKAVMNIQGEDNNSQERDHMRNIITQQNKDIEMLRNEIAYKNSSYIDCIKTQVYLKEIIQTR